MIRMFLYAIMRSFGIFGVKEIVGFLELKEL
jgi:hypothetical protein